MFLEYSAKISKVLNMELKTTTYGHSRIELYFVFLCLRIVHACFSNRFLATLFTRVIFFPESFSKNSNWPRMRSRGLLLACCRLSVKIFLSSASNNLCIINLARVKCVIASHTFAHIRTHSHGAATTCGRCSPVLHCG